LEWGVGPSFWAPVDDLGRGLDLEGWPGEGGWTASEGGAPSVPEGEGRVTPAVLRAVDSFQAPPAGAGRGGDGRPEAGIFLGRRPRPQRGPQVRSPGNLLGPRVVAAAARCPRSIAG